MKKYSILLTSLTIILIFISGWTGFRHESDDILPSVTKSLTPTDTSKTGARWLRTFHDDYFFSTSMTSSPIVTDKYIYVVNKDELYELSITDGSIVRHVVLDDRMNSVCHPVYDDDMIYIPLSGGRIECVSISSFTKLWTSGYRGGTLTSPVTDQSLCPVYLYKKDTGKTYIYSGTWVQTKKITSDDDVASDGVFYCLDAITGKNIWSYSDKDAPVGYYWNDSIIYADILWFISEDGTLISHSPTDDTVYDKMNISDHTQIRNGLCLDNKNSKLYTVSKSGKLISVSVDDTGHILSVDTMPLIKDAKSITCTSTPTLYDNKLYIGCAADGYGYLCIRDADTLSEIKTIQGGRYAEIKSSPLISIQHDAIYIYFTANDANGALYMYRYPYDANSGTSQMPDVISDSASSVYDSHTSYDTTDSDDKIEILFAPKVNKQYCLSSVCAGSDGTLYYSNDSGTLFAIAEVEKNADTYPLISPSPTMTPTDTKKDTSASVKPQKPTKFKIKKKRKKYIFTWKIKEKNSYTTLYIGKNKKKLTKYKTTKKTRISISIKKIKSKAKHIKSKKLYFRLRTKHKVKSVTAYSSYTKAIKISL